jgi:hypothetical protein
MSEWYLVFSVEHGAWWGPLRSGYVRSLGDAGRYSLAEALDICTHAIPGTSRLLGALPELPVREDHVLALHERFRREYPGITKEEWEP